MSNEPTPQPPLNPYFAPSGDFALLMANVNALTANMSAMTVTVTTQEKRLSIVERAIEGEGDLPGLRKRMAAVERIAADVLFVKRLLIAIGVGIGLVGGDRLITIVQQAMGH